MKNILKFILGVVIFISGVFVGEYLLGQEIKNRQNSSSPAPGLYPSGTLPNDDTTPGNSDIQNVDFVYADDYRSVTIRFVAVCNITNLQVKVVMKNSDGFLLDSQVIAVGNVIKGQQYLVKATLPDNEITNGKRIKTVIFDVYGGTINN